MLHLISKKCNRHVQPFSKIELLREKKRKKKDVKWKIEKTAETKCKFHGEELLGPGMKWIIQRTDRSDINEEY